MKSIIIIIAFVLASCANTTKDSTRKLGQRDTTFTAVAYILDWNTNDYRLSTARKITYDTLMPDSTNPKQNIIRDSTEYQVPIFINLIDSITKKPLLDSVGKQRQVVRWYILEKEQLLNDYNKDFKIPDSLKKRK
jgi:hypothetical protein